MEDGYREKQGIREKQWTQKGFFAGRRGLSRAAIGPRWVAVEHSRQQTQMLEPEGVREEGRLVVPLALAGPDPQGSRAVSDSHDVLL